MKKPQSKTRRIHYTLYIVPILFILTLIFINHPNTSALTYQNDSDLLFTINPSITLSVSGDLSINDLAPNTASDSNIITITAGSNSTLGYTLYTNVGDSTNAWTDLKLNGTDSTNKFSVLSSAVSTLDAIGASKWGYSYCDATSSPTNCDNTNNWVYGSAGSTATGYGIMPQYNSTTHANDIKLADTNSSSETTINFKIGAKAADTQATGTYTNVINFINIPKITTIDYSLTYTDNSSTTTSGTMPSPNPQTGTTTDGTFRLSTTKPTNTNSNLVFKAWCTANNSSDVTSCPGSTIYPGNLYVIGSSSSSFTTSVYAVWQDNSDVPPSICDTQPCMQDMNSTQLATLLPNVGDVTTLYDSRDEQAYTVAKLADNKYWMVENLNLAGGTAIESTKSNVDASYISSFSTSNNLTKSGNTIVLPVSSTSGFTDNNYSYVYNSGNKTNCGASGQKTPCYSYYSWDAATLGSGRSISTDNTDAQQSICPKGWKLPSTYNGSGTAAEATDFRALMIGYGGSNSIQTYNSSTTPTGATMYGNIGPGTTPNFLLAGLYNGGSFYDGGSYGYYWSSTSYSNANYGARYLYFDSSYVYSADYFYRRMGMSVRCLFSVQ